MLILLPQLFLDSPPPPYQPNFMSSTLPFQTTKERQQNKKQTIKLQNKTKIKKTKINGVCFVLTNDSWAWSVVDII